MFKKLIRMITGCAAALFVGVSGAFAASTNTVETVSSALETKMGLVVEKGIDATVALVMAGLVIFAVIFIVGQARKGARAGAGR